ncbi:hypothetical protein CPC16_004677, partial [Podila verticillata]
MNNKEKRRIQIEWLEMDDNKNFRAMFYKSEVTEEAAKTPNYLQWLECSKRVWQQAADNYNNRRGITDKTNTDFVDVEGMRKRYGEYKSNYFVAASKHSQVPDI